MQMVGACCEPAVSRAAGSKVLTPGCRVLVGLLPAGSVTDITWVDVRVGDAIIVKDDELFPSDLLCLYSALPDKVCFIKTTNLDGETNLKIRKPLDLRGLQPKNPAEVMALNIALTAEVPNRNLHKFKGMARVTDERYKVPLVEGGEPEFKGSEGGGHLGVMNLRCWQPPSWGSPLAFFRWF